MAREDPPAIPAGRTHYWEELERYFDAALGLELPDRLALLQELRARDPVLADELASLLEADAEAAALEPADSPADSPDPLIGARLGPYCVEARIGEGGTSWVYRARGAEEVEALVAIKVLRAELDPAAFLQRFEQERRTLAALRHPQIVAPLAAGSTADGRPYLVLELVEGQTLPVYCQTHGLGLAARLRLFERVLEAVAFAHRRMVIHCDLKPANLLVDRHGDPKLLDFGLSRLVDSTPAIFALTPAYASPEQLRLAPLTVATDVFSLGIVFGELLEQRGDRDLTAILARATAEDPEQRYPTVDALLADLAARRESRPVAARHPSLPYRASRFVRRHAILLTILGLLAAAAWTSYRAEKRAAAGEAVAWRAHAEAVWVTTHLAQLLEKLSDPAGPPSSTEPARPNANWCSRFSPTPSSASPKWEKPPRPKPGYASPWRGSTSRSTKRKLPANTPNVRPS